MTVMDYLSRPEDLRREIVRKKRRIETLRGMAGRLSARLQEVSVRSSPDPTRMQSLLAGIADGENELRQLEEDLRQSLADVARFISLLPEERLIRVLEARYLQGMAWEEITCWLGYSRASVFRYHNEAVSLLPPPPEIPGEDGF